MQHAERVHHTLSYTTRYEFATAVRFIYVRSQINFNEGFIATEFSIRRSVKKLAHDEKQSKYVDVTFPECI